MYQTGSGLPFPNDCVVLLGNIYPNEDRVMTRTHLLNLLETANYAGNVHNATYIVYPLLSLCCARDHRTEDIQFSVPVRRLTSLVLPDVMEIYADKSPTSSRMSGGILL